MCASWSRELHCRFLANGLGFYSKSHHQQLFVNPIQTIGWHRPSFEQHCSNEMHNWITTTSELHWKHFLLKVFANTSMHKVKLIAIEFAYLSETQPTYPKGVYGNLTYKWTTNKTILHLTRSWHFHQCSLQKINPILFVFQRHCNVVQIQVQSSRVASFSFGSGANVIPTYLWPEKEAMNIH